MNLKLPLRAVPRAEQEVCGQRIIEDADGVEIGYVSFDDYAEHVVYAVNNIGPLTKALQAARAAVMQASAKGERAGDCLEQVDKALSDLGERAWK